MKRFTHTEVLSHPKIEFLRELEGELHRLLNKAYSRLHDESNIAPLLEQARVRVTALRQLNMHELSSGHPIEPQAILENWLDAPPFPD